MDAQYILISDQKHRKQKNNSNPWPSSFHLFMVIFIIGIKFWAIVEKRWIKHLFPSSNRWLRKRSQSQMWQTEDVDKHLKLRFKCYASFLVVPAGPLHCLGIGTVEPPASSGADPAHRTVCRALGGRLVPCADGKSSSEHSSSYRRGAQGEGPQGFLDSCR